MRHDERMYVAPTESEELEAAAAGVESLLDALAAGTFTQDEFVERVLDCEASDPEAVWEVLALLDQYYRRKRIDRDTFVTLKGRLQRHSLGARGDARPMPRPRQADAAPRGGMVRDGTAPDGPARARYDIADSGADPDCDADADIDAEPVAREYDRWFAASAVSPSTADLPPMHAVDRGQGAQSSEPELLEASFHREVRAGDLLCGRYRAVEILRRREWMTTVEAVDEPKAGLPGIRQRVAVQVLDENLTQDPLVLQRIGKLQSLSHPSITRVLDVEDDNGALVLVTEFFSGSSLRDLLERRTDRRVPLQSALGIVRTLAGALAYAHARGVAHGELTAANVLITDVGDARLQGFELRAQSHAVQPAADRMAFARLAYELLAGTAEPVAALTATSLSRLRAPPGISRAQWRVLRDTLSGREGTTDTGIFAAFGGEAPVQPEPVFQDATGVPVLQQRRHVREWLAAGIVAAILGGGIYLYVNALSSGDQAGAEPAGATLADAATAAPQPPVEAPPEVATVTIAGNAATANRAGADATPMEPTATTPQRAAVVDPARSIEDTASNANGMNTGGALNGNSALPAPRTAPAQPVRPSIDLASTYAWVDTSEPVARIWVTRRGSLNREVTFRWWTETGTAQVDRDFRAIEPRVGVIPEGSRGVELLVPLMPDPARREPRTFYVKIDEPGPGVDLGTRTLMQVAIVPPGYPAARDTRAAQNLSSAPVP